MGRRLKIDRSVRVEVHIARSLWDKVQNELYSELEGKVPFGAQSDLVSNLFVDWLKARGKMI